MHQLNPLDPCLTLEKLAMKKTLIALAVLTVSGASFAQSSVQIDGVMDAGFQSINYKGNTVNGVAGNGSTTSQINFRGTEDLGGGLKANFRVETDWSTVSNMANAGMAASANVKSPSDTINGNGGTFGNGEIRVGLAGNFGAVNVGAVNYNSLSSYLTGQPFGTAIGSGFRTMYINDAQGTSQVRAENAINYVSPVFSGFNATLYKSNKQTLAKSVAYTGSSVTNLNSQPNAFGALGAYDQVGTQEIGVNYANGPLAASFSNLKQDFVGVSAPGSSLAAAGTAQYTVNTFGANYAVGDAKVFALYQTNKTDTNTVDNKAMSVSGTYTMGAVVLMAQMGELKNVAGLKSKMWGLGADYNLSKRTAVYFRAESFDDKASAVQAAVTPGAIKGTDTTFARTAVGIRAAF
jgi:predicted porin